MLKLRTRRRTIQGTQAIVRLAGIQASIIALNDEDLLDLADIFAQQTPALLKEMATTEMAKRNLSL